jgi:hypothetical protein
MPTDRDKLLADFRKAVAGILNIAANEIPDDAKIMLAQILQVDPGSLRLHVRLEPFTVSGAVFAADRKTAPVELFRIIDVPKNEDFN